MEGKPIKIQLVRKEGSDYQIKFPYLKVPVTVNEQLYLKMLHSPDYSFTNPTASVARIRSA